MLWEKIFAPVSSVGCTGHIYTGGASTDSSPNPWEPLATRLLWSAMTSVPCGEPIATVQLVRGSFGSPRGHAWSMGSAQGCAPARVCVSQRALELLAAVWSSASGISPGLIAGAEEMRSLQVPKLEARCLILLRNVEDVPTVLLLPIFHPPGASQNGFWLCWGYCPLRSAAH